MTKGATSPSIGSRCLDSLDSARPPRSPLMPEAPHILRRSPAEALDEFSGSTRQDTVATTT